MVGQVKNDLFVFVFGGNLLVAGIDVFDRCLFSLGINLNFVVLVEVIGGVIGWGVAFFHPCPGVVVGVFNCGATFLF